MMRRRNDGISLPTSSLSSNTPDGSGRGIHMDAPIVRAAKNSSTYTRGSYAVLVFSVLLIWWAWVDIHFHDAYTHLNCENDECVLTIHPPARAKPLTLNIAREQIVESMSLMVDVEGRPMIPISGMKHHHHFENHHRHHEGEEKEHESYAIVLSQNGARNEEEKLEEALEGIVSPETLHNMEKFGSAAMTDPTLLGNFISQKNDIANAKIDKKVPSKKSDLPNLDALEEYADKNQMGEFVLVMRKYNIGHTRRKVPTLVTRIKQYAKSHRNKINVREKRTIRWQGIVGIILGIFSLLISLIVGQFSEPSRTFGGPGASQRRRKTKSKAYGGYDHRG